MFVFMCVEGGMRKGGGRQKEGVTSKGIVMLLFTFFLIR